jgi:hypothetical protein
LAHHLPDIKKERFFISRQISIGTTIADSRERWVEVLGTDSFTSSAWQAFSEPLCRESQSKHLLFYEMEDVYGSENNKKNTALNSIKVSFIIKYNPQEEYPITC